ncbi:Glycosyl transferase family 2 [Rubrobacter radiotolerans]|uniref:Glucosyl-3-phosphoglycerate synthase n=1 Tax=Rubrobacter radiotolerans TaxID=42256 RepID=A0A023X0B4_RUBRA|nr:glucosyl-3-phosphoglycerate synthase [Rubrobacter radiotolerans]AHY45783.1 Glycosyl transferase family 2 [Rubrobacter radiotolerans]MDX5893198.1 glucosyl-3-phosphoglycerate synthase [Rubrobacter radiotolerans]SMC03249.1 glucosyl-3-phosphoglycerate synthase [Rubrobacter radiotolerans DSM 5868]
MTINVRDLGVVDAAEWFRHRSYDYTQFSIEGLGRKKAEQNLTVDAVLPGRNVADTIGGIVDEIHAVNQRSEREAGVPLVDRILVVDADSPDGTARVAREHGAEVFSENELMSHYGGAHGKGDAMWRALSVASGDLVMYMDTDTKDFRDELVWGVLGPILTVPQVRYVKAAYRRPFKAGEKLEEDGGGRVTELSAKPLFNLFYPELAGFVQPLAGEFVADRELFSSIPFMTGYAVETNVMIDVLNKVGLAAMAQVDLGTRQNRHQPLRDLSRMSYAVLRAVARRMREDGRLDLSRDKRVPPSLNQFSDYLHAVATPDGLKLNEYVEELVERPPIRDVVKNYR